MNNEELDRFKRATEISVQGFNAKERNVIAKYWENVNKELTKLKKEDKKRGIKRGKFSLDKELNKND